jgi:hypothetical protein
MENSFATIKHYARCNLPQQAKTVGKVRGTVGQHNYQQPTVRNNLLGVFCRARLHNAESHVGFGLYQQWLTVANIWCRMG